MKDIFKFVIILSIMSLAFLSMAANVGYFNATSYEWSSGNATETSTDISFTNSARSVRIFNDDTDSSIRINPGGGTTMVEANYTSYIEIQYGESLELEMIMSACGIYSEDGNAAYRLIALED